MKYITRLLIVLMTLWATNGVVSAATVGERFISVEFGMVDTGDDLELIEDYLDDIYVYGASLQLPFADHFAVIGSVSRTSIKGDFSEDGISASMQIDLMALTAGAQIHLLPGQLINPFVGAAYSFTKVDVEVSLLDEKAKDDDWEQALILAAGAEVNFTDQFSLVVSFARSDRQDSSSLFADELEGQDLLGSPEEKRNSVNASLNYWLSQQFLVSATYARDLEDDTSIIGARLGLRF